MAKQHKVETQEPLPFNLFDYYNEDEPIPSVHALIQQGKLPPDCLFRLSVIGCRQIDPDNPQWLLQWNVLWDMVKSAGDADKMNPVTHSLLFGDRPDAIIDYWQTGNRDSYTLLDPMYYRRANLIRAIRELRVERGTSLDELPGYMHSPESQRCRALSQALWRVIIQKIHPEWLANPGDYSPPTISFGNVYYPGERTMRSRNIAHAVISDTVVFGIYAEAVETGVKGIGPSGRESLRKLLSDEHPELQ